MDEIRQNQLWHDGYTTAQVGGASDERSILTDEEIEIWKRGYYKGKGDKIIPIIGSDHGGYYLKKRIIDYFQKKGLFIIDGDLHQTYDKTDDFPDFIHNVIRNVADQSPSGYFRGILVCGTGIGMCVAANKNNSIRAANCTNVMMAQQAVEHNDCNVLCLGSFLDDDTCYEIIESFLKAKFNRLDPKYQRRLDKIVEIESSNRIRVHD